MAAAAPFSFEAQAKVIGCLVCTVNNDPAKWSPSTRKALSSFYTQHLFFCPALVELRKRAKEVHDVLNEEGYFVKDDDPFVSTSFMYKRLASATQGQPVSLRTICKIKAALDHIASDKESVRRVTMKRAKGKAVKRRFSCRTSVWCPLSIGQIPSGFRSSARTR